MFLDNVECTKRILAFQRPSSQQTVMHAHVCTTRVHGKALQESTTNQAGLVCRPPRRQNSTGYFTMIDTVIQESKNRIYARFQIRNLEGPLGGNSAGKLVRPRKGKGHQLLDV